MKSRETVVDFTYPFFFDKMAITYKPGLAMTESYFLFLLPFEWSLWLCLTILVPVLGILGFILCLTSRENRESVPMLQNLWESFGILCYQGVLSKHDKPVLHSLQFSWVVFCLVIMTIYSGNLVAMLAVQNNDPPFNSLEELTAQTSYTYGVEAGTSNLNFIMNSPGAIGTMYLKMKRWEADGIPVMATSIKDYVQLLKKGGHAHISDRYSAKKVVQEHPELAYVTTPNLPPRFGVAFQENSAYRDIASETIMNLAQTGFLGYWEKKYEQMRRSKMKHTKHDHDSLEGHPIRLSSLYGFFVAFLTLILTALVSLVIENIIFFCRPLLQSQIVKHLR